MKVLKKINKYLSEDIRLRLLPYYRKILPNIKNILFLPQLQCNYSCRYCILDRFTPEEFKLAFHSYKEWIKVFEDLPPCCVTITGGEPLLYKDIFPLIENFPSKHFISSLVTNLSLNVNKLLSLRKKDFRIMASFHPEMTTQDIFMQNVLMLKRAGFNNITINFVAYPPYLNIIPSLKKFFEREKGVYFRVDTFKDPHSHYSQQQLELIRDYKKKGIIAWDRTEGYDFDDFSVKHCSAGKNFFVLIANGNVYSCMEGYYYSVCEPYKDKHNSIDTFYLGNLFDGTFRPLDKCRICHSPCAELCDIELAGVK